MEKVKESFLIQCKKCGSKDVDVFISGLEEEVIIIGCNDCDNQKEV